jgi:tRNA(fMet)-specific endonuclease VapC
MKLLDTCFLIDLQRELKANRTGAAVAYLKAHSQERFAISVIGVTEFLEGFPEPEEGEKQLRAFHWLNLDGKTAKHAAIIRRQLRLEGRLIGDFDILIAATALAENLPLVTNNIEHFDRIHDLVVEKY